MIDLLASLENIVIELRKKKQEATKLRQKAEKQVKEFRSAEKRSSSGLDTIDKKIELEREESGDVSTILLRKKCSIGKY